MPFLRRAPAPVSAAVIEGLGWVNYRLVPGNQAIYDRAVDRVRDELGDGLGRPRRWPAGSPRDWSTGGAATVSLTA